MDKSKAAETLRKKGYNVKDAGGILQFFYPEGVTDYDAYIIQIRKDVKDIGYDGSWGCKYSKEENSVLTTSKKEEEFDA